MGGLKARGTLTPPKKDPTGASVTGGSIDPITLFNLHMHPVKVNNVIKPD